MFVMAKGQAVRKIIIHWNSRSCGFAMKNLQRPEQATKKMSETDIWPSEDYAQQVARLRAARGEPVYLVELRPTEISMPIHLSGKAVTLLDVIEFPDPDPEKRNYPHMIILDDGRGINLGHVARVSTGTVFDPAPSDILFEEMESLQRLVYRKRRLSRVSLVARARQVLAAILGKSDHRRIE